MLGAHDGAQLRGWQWAPLQLLQHSDTSPCEAAAGKHPERWVSTQCRQEANSSSRHEGNAELRGSASADTTVVAHAASPRCISSKCSIRALLLRPPTPAAQLRRPCAPLPSSSQSWSSPVLHSHPTGGTAAAGRQPGLPRRSRMSALVPAPQASTVSAVVPLRWHLHAAMLGGPHGQNGGGAAVGR